MRNVPDKVVDKIITHVLYSLTSPPPPENRAVHKIMWKNMVVRQATILYGACVLRAGYLRLKTHTQNR